MNLRVTLQLEALASNAKSAIDQNPDELLRQTFHMKTTSFLSPHPEEEILLETVIDNIAYQLVNSVNSCQFSPNEMNGFVSTNVPSD